MKKLILTMIVICFACWVFAQGVKVQGSIPDTSTTIKNSSSTINCSVSDDEYSLIVVSSRPLPASVKALIIQTIGKPQTEISDTVTWNLGTTYTVNLKARRLVIDLDKGIAPANLAKTFAELGQKIQRLLTPVSTATSPEKN